MGYGLSFFVQGENIVFYKLILPCLFLLFYVFACQSVKHGEPILFQQDGSRSYVQSTQVKVMVNPEEISPGKTPEDILWSRAEQQAMSKIMNVWLSQGLLLQPSLEQVYDPGSSNFMRRQGEVRAVQDELTEIYTQEFVLDSRFEPIKQVSGTIVKLEDKHAIAGQLQFLRINLADLTPDEQGAYFLVATGSDSDQTGMLRLIGSGKIYHVLDSMAQAVLMETKQEVRTGDIVFLLNGLLQPVQPAEPAAAKSTELPDKEEIVVEPKAEKAVPEPKGSQ